MNRKKSGRRSGRPEIRPQNRAQFFGAEIITDLQIQQQAASDQPQEVIRLEYGDSKLIDEFGLERWLELARKRYVSDEDRERLIRSGKRGVTLGMVDRRFERLTASQKDLTNSTAEEFLTKLYETLPGALLLCWPRGEKGTNRQWKHLTYDDTQEVSYQRALLDTIARGGNIGVALGPKSRNLRAIDIDDPEIGEWFRKNNPFVATTLVSHGYQVWFYCENCPNGQGVYKLRDETGRECGEFRCGEADSAVQSIIFGIHPSKAPYEIENFVIPQMVDFNSIKWPGAVPGEEESCVEIENEDEEPISAYPEIGEAAFQGPLGRIVKDVQSLTEADPAAILAQLLVGWGNLIGRGPYFPVASDRHYTNLNCCVVGKSGRAPERGRAFRSALDTGPDRSRLGEG